MIFWMRRSRAAPVLRAPRRSRRRCRWRRWAVVLLAFLAVGREGLETSLFLWTAVQAAGQTAGAADRRSCSASRTAVALGSLIYRGAVRINLGSSSPGPARCSSSSPPASSAYGVHDLQEGGVLPGIDTPRLRRQRRRARSTPGTARCSRASSTSPPRPPGSRPRSGSRTSRSSAPASCSPCARRPVRRPVAAVAAAALTGTRRPSESLPFEEQPCPRRALRLVA